MNSNAAEQVKEMRKESQSLARLIEGRERQTEIEIAAIEAKREAELLKLDEWQRNFLDIDGLGRNTEALRSELGDSEQALRLEIEPRPAAIGGGWHFHMIGVDPETERQLQVGCGTFPMLQGWTAEKQRTSSVTL